MSHNAAIVALLLTGCASPDRVCDMRIDYERMGAVAQSGSVRIGGLAGTLHGLLELANQIAGVQLTTIQNRGVQNRQTGGNSITTSSGYGFSTSTNNYGTDDLSLASTVDFTLIKAAATDNMILESWKIVVNYAP